MANILAVDDEIAILNIIQRILSKSGHKVVVITDPTELNQMKFDSFNLILLDVMMPIIDGFYLCKEIRNKVDCPILFLTAKTDEKNIVHGLDCGADDYVCKPFGAEELRARVAAHLRRDERKHFIRLSMKDAQFNLSAKQFVVKGELVALTPSEYEICEMLAQNTGQVFSREQIYETVFGFDGDSNDNTIITHIKNIRSKLEEVGYSPIKTVWGVGYKWEI